MKASIGDVALRAGVSNATVSRTFAHPEQVSEATRNKVQAAAEALNFSISRSAGILKSGRTYRVALLVGSHTIEWFTAEIIAGLNDILQDAGYDLVIYPIEGATARDTFFEELPVRNNADAVFVSSFGISPDEVKRLGTAKIPIVGVNTTNEGFDATIGIDDREGIKLIVRHLAKLGHRNLLYLYKNFPSTLGFSSCNRITGFQEACNAIDGMNAHILAVQPNDNIIDAAISEMMMQDNPPTALCFHQDSQAIPLFFRLQRSGLSIPLDISVTGFDDSTFAEEAQLTTVRQKPYDMAVAAAKKALDLIEGRPVSKPFETFPVQLQVRSSTAKPRTTSLL
jgi:LacI family transcriptional regulator, repressor for deo operon, udp, cdd, tsx, nupC, and nupG